MKVRLYRIEGVHDGHVSPLGVGGTEERAEAFAAMERAALGEEWTVRVTPFDREVFITPIDEPLLPVPPGPQPHPPVWPAVGAVEFNPFPVLPDEPLLPISPKRDKALKGEEEL